MTGVNLRLRVFLFFALLGLGSAAIVLAAHLFGYRQLAQPGALSAFATSAIISVFGVIALSVSIWLLFDEHVSKPVEAIAASLRVRTHTDAASPLDKATGRYLGDLAAAADAATTAREHGAKCAQEADAPALKRLEDQRDQLVQILSDIPIATILVSSAHRIVLYDGQAAAVLDRVGAARLNASIFDYFEKAPIVAALNRLDAQGTPRLEVTVTSLAGEVCTGHLRSFGADAGYTLMLDPLRPAAARPLTYDFDLMTYAPTGDLLATPLRDLTFVVFDTETTGLDPVTDDVVQLGAVRVVNGKIVRGEVLNSYVNPGRPIPARSTAVHGVSDAMVAGAPPMQQVCTRFHDFADGAVLVAHNAAFDMAFLHRQAAGSHAAFDNPVLDTVLISAVIFGGSAVHTLDALCDRLGVVLPPEERHTALGDAMATAKALVATLGILEGRGIRTFGDLHSEMHKHQRILRS